MEQTIFLPPLFLVPPTPMTDIPDKQEHHETVLDGKVSAERMKSRERD